MERSNEIFHELNRCLSSVIKVAVVCTTADTSMDLIWFRVDSTNAVLAPARVQHDTQRTSVDCERSHPPSATRRANRPQPLSHSGSPAGN